MFRNMRLTKQQLTMEETIDILNRKGIGTLALTGEEGYPYSVPVNYLYYEGKLYFHGAKSGYKAEIIKKNPKASISIIDEAHVVAEKYTTDYQSVIAFGKISILDDPEKIGKIMKNIALKFCGKYGEEVDAQIMQGSNRMAVYEMEIDYMTGKRASID